MAVREGRWDCQYCGTTGILGRYKVCSNCARSRPEGTEFYLPGQEKEPVVEDGALLQEAAKGPDWICAYCTSSNAADADVCRHCDAPRESTSPQQKVQEYGVGEVPTSGDMSLETPPERQAPPPAPEKGNRPKWLLPAGLGLLAFLVLAGALLLFQSSEVDVTVADISWERTIEIEALETVVEEDWTVPSGGRIIDEREEVRRYDSQISGYETKERQVSEQVQVGVETYTCGQRDLGNGFFEDVECSRPVYETQYRTETYEEPIYVQVPVFGTLYTYEIDRWRVARTVEASDRNQQPYWPDFSLATGEREGERHQHYQIIFVDDDGEEYEMVLGEEEWLAIDPGGSYQLEVNALGNPVEIVP